VPLNRDTTAGMIKKCCFQEKVVKTTYWTTKSLGDANANEEKCVMGCKMQQKRKFYVVCTIFHKKIGLSLASFD